MKLEWLKLENSTRKRNLERATISTGLPPEAIEKDWWVTLTLRALFRTPYAQFCILKGGLSLSKAWNLLHRFSDDIDIALLPEAFGMQYHCRPTHSYLKRLKKRGCIFVATQMKDALVKAFEELGISADDIAIRVGVVRKKDPQIIFIRYRSVITSQPVIPAEIKIEFSVRNLKDPFAELALQSILSAVLPGDMAKEDPFIAQVAMPHKTLLEKMFLLHEKFSNRKAKPWRSPRQCRHLYDIVQLMNTTAGSDALSDTALYAALIQHRRLYTRLRNVDYSTLDHAELCFVPPLKWVEKIRSDYDSVKDSMFYRQSIAFDELLNQLRSFNRKMSFAGQHDISHLT